MVEITADEAAAADKATLMALNAYFNIAREWANYLTLVLYLGSVYGAIMSSSGNHAQSSAAWILEGCITVMLVIIRTVIATITSVRKQVVPKYWLASVAGTWTFVGMTSVWAIFCFLQGR